MHIKPWVGFILLIFIIAIPIFAHLDSFPLSEWDEARIAMNSLEMSYNHSFIVTTCYNSPEMCQLKPPLLIWLQAGMLKIFGLNELAIRFPSALAALGTCLIVFFFFTKKYKESLFGLICVATLITTDGYLHSHTARSGEYDSLLTMFTTGYVLFYFLYLEGNRKKYLYATFTLLTLAAFTKGIQSFLFLPGLFIYTIYKKKLITTLKQKELYLGLAGLILFVIGYYLLREHYNPGYISAVLGNELGRYNVVLEEHRGDAFTYFNWITDIQFHYWYLLVLPGIICGICSQHKWLKDLTIYNILLISFYLIIVSDSQTKIPWYTMPLYPFLSILVAIFIYSVVRALWDMNVLKDKFTYNPFPVIFLILIFTMPYTAIINMVMAPPEGYGSTDEMKNMELFLHNVLHNTSRIDGCSIVNTSVGQQIDWYYKVFDRQHRRIMHIDEKDLAPDMLVVAFRQETKKRIEEQYNTQVIQTFYNVTEYKLNDRK